MSPDPGEKGPWPWISVGDLSEWVYCPRAHYYRHHAPRAIEEPQAEIRRAAGRRYHEEWLTASLVKGPSGGWWIGLAVGVGLLLTAALVLGVL